MGESCSAISAGEKEIKLECQGDPWKHDKCTVRAHHQLSILLHKEDCDYCQIVCNVRRKTYFRCDESKLNFWKRNHFFTWHSAKCDHFRAYT